MKILNLQVQSNFKATKTHTPKTENQKLSGGLDLQHLPYEIRYTEKFGRGLYATQKIPRNTVVIRAPILYFSVPDTARLLETALRHYTFADFNNDAAAWLPLGHAVLINHSSTPNMSWRMFDDTTADFYTLTSLAPGDQLLSNYGYTPTKHSASAFKWLHS